MKTKEKEKKIPGDNCCIVGCGVNRRSKSVGILKLPSEEVNKEWRLKWLNEITKSRVDDESFTDQLHRDRAYICEKHFKLDDIDICKNFFPSKIGLYIYCYEINRKMHM